MKKLLTTVSITITILVLAFLVSQKSDTAVASVSGLDSYHSTTTDATWSAVAHSSKVLKTGYGMLGSVVITRPTTGTLVIYDGTTTSSHSDHATTTLAVFPATATAGTYTFDTSFNYGLLVENDTGNVATSTITWK